MSIMDASQQPAQKLKAEISTRKFIPFYTGTVIFFGVLIAAYTFRDLPGDLVGLSAFAILAALSELFHIELFKDGRAHVSISSIITTASIFSLGTSAGVVTCIASGLMTGISDLRRRDDKTQYTSWLHRSAFNIGMWVVVAFISGTIFASLGGYFGGFETTRFMLPALVTVAIGQLANITILTGVLALQTGKSILEIWNDNFRWSEPIQFLSGVVGGSALALAYNHLGLLGVASIFLPIFATNYSYSLYARNMKQWISKLESVNQELDDANLGLLRTLGAVVDAYDIFTYGHSAQVAVYAEALAARLGLKQADVDDIFRAALVHDIGKIGISETIINKQGPLTEEEYTLVKRHSIIGADIVAQMKGLHDIVPLIRHHHERWDGKGYPGGLKGDDIPVGARVIALSDALDTMCSDRPYRATMNFSEVVQEIKSCSGTQFDPYLVQVYLELVQEKGNEFFKNSASTVENLITPSTRNTCKQPLRYMKRGMINLGESVLPLPEKKGA